MNESNRLYRTFLIRCWQEGEALPGQPPKWRYSLTQIGDVEQMRGFTDYACMVAYMETQIGASLPSQIPSALPVLPTAPGDEPTENP